MSDGTQSLGMLGWQSGVAALALIVGIAGTALSARAQTLPTDAVPLCAVPSATFNGWFQSGSAALNGLVMPANSVGFSGPANSNCPFYQWAEQMFMWVTSPVPSAPGSGYGAFAPGNGATPGIFDSTAFFDVSPPVDAAGHRTLVPHPTTLRFVRDALPRGRKPGPGGLPLVKARRGGMIEVEPLRLGPTGKALITDAAGKSIEIARVRVVGNARAALFDSRGRVIALRRNSTPSPGAGHFPRAMLIRSICRAGAVCNAGATGGSLIDVTTGSVIEVESGQASDNFPDFPVVMTQNKSLIYYSIMVNDVYAWFLVGTRGGGISPAPATFPTTHAELDNIVAFAASQGASFPDSSALTVELKASWIDASTLPTGAVASYITTQASIPAYTPSAKGTQWTQGPNKPATLALVGMHVVGSALGHPEMIFATFEHLGNAPNAPYSYIYNNLIPGFPLTKTVPQDTGGWLLSKNGSTGMFNQQHMAILNQPVGTIQALPPFPIGPSDTLRLKAWGAASDSAPNPNVASPAQSNTEVISINNSVHGMMTAAGAGADVRNNYIMIGATWTQGGAGPGITYLLPPTIYNKPGDKTTMYPANVVGASQLFNSTMETYDQGHDTTLLGSLPNNQGIGDNCFDCHGSSTTGSLAMTNLSHIFQWINATIPK